MSSMSVSVPSEIGRRAGGLGSPASVAASPSARPAVVGPVAGPVPHDGGAEAARDVGQLHAVHAAAVVVVEREHLGQLGGAALLVEDGDVGAGEHEVLDRLAVDRSASSVNSRSSTKPNSSLTHERLGGLAQLVLGADERAEPAYPRDPLVALVPDQARARPPGGARGRSRAAPGRGRTSGRPARTRRRRRSGRATGMLLGAGDRRRAYVGQVALRRTSSIAGVGVGGVHVVAEGRPAARVSLPVPAPSSRTVTGLGRRPARPRPRRGTTGGRGRRPRRRRRRSAPSRGRSRARGRSSRRRLPATGCGRRLPLP